MTIDYSPRFKKELLAIHKFIAKDSLNRANHFKNEIKSNIESISSFPLKHRQSQQSDNPNLRELIYKGYTIAYLVDELNDQIILLGIFNQNQWEK